MYSSGNGMFRGSPVTFKASGAETASTSHPSLDTGAEGGSLVVTVAVTAASGTTPTMTVVVEGSADGGTNWIPLAVIGANGYTAGGLGGVTNFTGAATTRAVVPKPQMVRTRSVIGGTTPSFTYSVNCISC